MSDPILLDEVSHTYSCGKRRLEAVGSLVKRVTPPFDADKVAERVARRDGRTTAAVKAEWAQKRDVACDKGHLVHAGVKHALCAVMAGKPEAVKANGSAPREFHHWLDWWAGAGQFLKPIAVECVVGDVELGFAGTFDTLFESSKTNQYHAFDWKSNNRFDTESPYGDRMLPPFEDLPSCHHVHYSLQVELYALALEREGRKVGPGWLVHLSEAGAKPYKALDLRRRAEEWVRSLKL